MKFGRVAQLARVTALQAVGHRFEPCPAYQTGGLTYRARGVAWPNTSACHAEDRGFESRRARQLIFYVLS
jgi:hypothetical protein